MIESLLFGVSVG